MDSKKTTYISILYAILAAALFGMSAPLSKLLLAEISPLMLASLVYLGAGMGMLIIDLIRRVLNAKPIEARLEKKELPYILAMIILDILAPISLMIGLTMTSAANAALLNNFEIVATSLIALIIFREAVGKRLWVALTLITLASVLLSTQDISNLSFSLGSIFVLLSCVFWGLENNCTRKLSIKDPLQVVILKGIGSGTGALIVAAIANELSLSTLFIIPALLLGFFAYGLSIFFYVKAQRTLGAARTSAYYAVAPFIGVILSFIFFNEAISLSFIFAILIIIVGTYFAVSEDHEHDHTHIEISHEHRHHHEDSHHNHHHETQAEKEHAHSHVHEKMLHKHAHTPDIHHHHIH